MNHKTRTWQTRDRDMALRLLIQGYPLDSIIKMTNGYRYKFTYTDKLDVAIENYWNDKAEVRRLKPLAEKKLQKYEDRAVKI